MWIIFGVGAVVFAFFNILWSARNKEARLFSFVSLSLTALTLCAFYHDAALRVVNEDWGGLMDILPTMSKALWVCTIISVLINSVAYFCGKHR